MLLLILPVEVHLCFKEILGPVRKSGGFVKSAAPASRALFRLLMRSCVCSGCWVSSSHMRMGWQPGGSSGGDGRRRRDAAGVRRGHGETPAARQAAGDGVEAWWL